MARGRPTSSQIRQNIIEILYFMGSGYGYDIFRHYVRIFPKVTLRSIYYHLKKGLSLEEFKVKEIVSVRGEYSWGSTAEKKMYSLGPNASPSMSKEVKKYFDSNK